MLCYVILGLSPQNTTCTVSREQIVFVCFQCHSLTEVAAVYSVGCQIVCKYYVIHKARGWLGSRVVSVLDSGAEGPGSDRCRVTVLGNALAHCASVHRAAKLVAALLRVAAVTAGLAESNGSLPPGL